MRSVNKQRDTKETQISCYVNLDGDGTNDIHTGVGFFDHMLTLFSFHSGIDVKLKANGDLNVCDHHTVEDCGILLGTCVKEALQDKRGIARYGNMMLPMDETLCNVTLDISGRPYLVYHCELKRDQIGNFSCEMVEEFLRAFAFAAGITLHVNVYYGVNDHHKIEAIFKALGRALKAAVKVEGDALPSTKGKLE
ncbi:MULTISPECIES: imidazoleglycerol-phosphate dehydratase HisB [Bacillota]|jgi:imidazoleglycerol-phosphate dehydratase|uniref:Imidazoleglycerol-phosphate dehydratase n=2 Tax=Amedibacillus TaxID=2749846 RepID=A0A7G9GJD9_9FIRM|nr:MULTISPECIES: imidazoleglycerol-phosphate dehydratase HisB [Bacillota]QNM10921.1 imidazoleglycerol-phosphate dehydratase HisB [[Eubacterium] hominis]MCH4285357.1 imidazoleglycerol-phosphate dehydratase HisB [Amedibacillus hominis]RGB58413.1 imidazoleglycerol-phosphate dehydratase HisB [Absiella sp. AM22-9]RGB63301.1 imidazoleglycerol-phosphate dehydratase HisB [Absiella sp. AM10-20]RGB67131.1 imidazoleglycerol-phosphate dehydratase HisB [Absiella sp. AM09-45]